MGFFFSKPAPPKPEPPSSPVVMSDIAKEKQEAYETWGKDGANPGNYAYRGGKTRKRSRKHKRKTHRRRR